MKHIWGRLAACLWMVGLLGSWATAQDATWSWTESAGWSRYEGSAKGTAAEQYVAARNHERKGEYYDAARQYFLLVRTFPNSQEGKEGVIRLSNCLFRMENFYHSFKALESCIRRYPKSIHLQKLLEMEMRIGRKFMDGAPVRLIGRNTRKDSLKAAIEIFNAVYRHDQTGPFADSALLESGRAYLELGKPSKAKDQFAILVATFRESPLVPVAQYLNERASILQGTGSIERARHLLQVVRASQHAARANPAVQQVMSTVAEDEVELKEKDAGRLLASGDYYAKQKSPKSFDAAMFTYKEVVRRYPETKSARLAQERLKVLAQGGRPKKGFLDGEFNTPKINLPNPVSIFRRKPKDPAEAKKTQAAEPLPALSKIPGPAVFPTGEQTFRSGQVVVDLRAEEAELDALSRGDRASGFEMPAAQKSAASQSATGATESRWVPAPVAPLPSASKPKVEAPNSAPIARTPALVPATRAPQPVTPVSALPSSGLPQPMVPLNELQERPPQAAPPVVKRAAAPTQPIVKPEPPRPAVPAAAPVAPVAAVSKPAPASAKKAEEEDLLMVVPARASVAPRKVEEPKRTPPPAPVPTVPVPASAPATPKASGWSFSEDLQD